MDRGWCCLQAISRWPRSHPPPKHGDSYTIHPLPALDGVLLYVALNGETVGFYFGRDEEAAAERVAEDLINAAAARNGVSA